MRAGRSFAVVVVAAMFAAGTAGGELVRVESVGSVPLAAGATGGATARQAALEAGVREAVERAALDLAAQAGSNAKPEAVRTALGGDLLLYASRFRIVEDRGERAPLLEQSPTAEHEYVVMVETHVDRSRIRSKLQQAGLIGAAPKPGARRSLRIAFEGVDSYPVWKRIQRVLSARGGASRPLEFGHRRVVAEVETEEEASALIGRLSAALSDSLELHSVGMDGEMLLVAVKAPGPAEATVPAPDPNTAPAVSPAESAPAPSAR
jgi:hypothetical protein